MTAPPTFSSVPEEVEYYDRLLYRLVMTKDEQLEASLHTHLPTLLETLGTSHEAVRNKVVECCSHILKRIRAIPALQLPCSVLVSKIKASSSSTFTRNFAMIFLELGVPRLQAADKARLSVDILHGLSDQGSYSRHQTALVHRLLDVIEHMPSTAAALTALHEVVPKPSPADLSFLSDLFLDILLIPNASKLPKPTPPSPNAAAPPLLVPLPGLPRESLERLSSHPTRWDSQTTLARVKLDVIRVLHSPLFPHSSAILPHLLIASTDSETRVKERAESLVRLLVDLRQRSAAGGGGGAAAAGVPPTTTPTTGGGGAVEEDVGGTRQEEVEEEAERRRKREREEEDSKLAGTILRLYLGGQDCPIGPGPTGTLLYRPLLSEPSRVLLVDWAIRECPESLALHEALCTKAILQSLTAADASLPIRALGARLAAFFAARCRQASFPLTGPLLLASIQQSLVSLYQQLAMYRASSAGTTGDDRNSQTREHCYSALTSVAHRLSSSGMPELLFRDLSLLRLLLHSLTLEGPMQAIKVSEAMGAMLTAFTTATKRLGRPPQDASLLRPLLHAAATSSAQMRSRLAAVEWASQAFPPHDLLFRTMCLHLADDSAQAVRKAAISAMGLGSSVEQQRDPLPPFPDKRDSGGDDDDDDGDNDGEKMAMVGGGGGGGRYPPFTSLVDALLSTKQEASPPSPSSPSFVFSLDSLGTIGEALALYLTWVSLLHSSTIDSDTSGPHMTRVLTWIRRGALPDFHTARADRILVYRAASAFLLRFSHLVAPGRLLSAFIASPPDFRWVQGWLGHEDKDVRVGMAGFLGRLSLVMEPQQRDVALYTLSSAIDAATARRDGRAAHGPLLAVGHIVAEWAAAGQDDDKAASSDSAALPLVPVKLVSVSAVVTAGSATTSGDDLHAAACASLSLMGQAAPLPLPRGQASATDTTTTTMPPGSKSVDDVVSMLVTDVSGANGKERRAEAAAACLSCLARRDPLLPRREEVIKACVGVGAVKDPEVQLAVGEALASVALWQLDGVLSPVLEKAADHSPHIRSAAALWLLSMVTESESIPAILPRLLDVQPVLIGLMKDDSELTQEASGKALASIYDASEPDPALRAALLENLVQSFKGSGDRTGLEVNAPSSQAPLPTNVDLGPTHFREICSLALDLHRPELLYTFLALPCNHAAWSGLRASKHLSSGGKGRRRRKRGEELQASLEPLLPQVVPRLYRARFEPSGPARKSMEQLWRVVSSPDPKAMVKRFLAQILEELVGQSLGSRKWRERQAGASALADILSGRTFAEIFPLLERLWIGTFRVMDDLKESVALAGLDLAKSLSTLSSRLSNRTETPPEQVREVVGLLLPILLQRGLLEKNKHVQALSVLTLCRVVKGAGDCIKPYVADLISVLIESMSAIEPAELQYMQFHSSAVEMSEEDVEKLRYSLSRSGPLQEALDLCLKELDSSTITDLMPRLVGHLRSGVGLNTRCCAANVVVVLAARFRPEVRPHIPALLQVLAAGALAERSVTAQRFFLGALKSVSKLASEWENRRLIMKLAREYRRCSDTVVYRPRRLGVVSVLRQICSASGERLEEGTWRPLLPLAYVGKFDQEEAVKEAWQEIWAEGCTALGKGGNTARALAGDMVSEVEATMRATSWLSRQQSCRAIEDMTAVLGPALQLHAFRLARMLVMSLPGRLWEGKEMALQALVSICVKAPSIMVVAAGGGRQEEEEEWLLEVAGEGRSFPTQLQPKERGGGAMMDVVVTEGQQVVMEVDDEEDGKGGEGEGGPPLASAMEGVEPSSSSSSSSSGSSSLPVGGGGGEVGRDEAAFEEFVTSTTTSAPNEDDTTTTNLATTSSPSSSTEAAPMDGVTTVAASADGGAHQHHTSGDVDGKISVRGLVSLLVGQCQRPSRDYRRAAIACITQLVLAYPLPPPPPQGGGGGGGAALLEDTLRGFAKLEGEVVVEEEEGKGGGGGDQAAVDHVARARAVEALGAVFPTITTTGQAQSDEEAAAYHHQREVLSWLLPGLLTRLSFAVWSFRLSSLQCLRRIVERLYVRPDGDGGGSRPTSLLSSAVVDKVLGACAVGMADAKYVQVREAALGVMQALVKRTETDARIAYLPHADQIEKMLSQGRADSQPAVVMLATEVAALFAR